MAFFDLAPSMKGYITPLDLLSTTGTFVFFTKKSELKNGGFIFSLGGEDFIFSLSIQNMSVVLQRNNTISVLTINKVPDEERLGFYIMWSYSKLTIICKYGSNEEDQLKSEVETEPIAPPIDLIRWSRKNNLIPKEEYSCQEEFRNKVHSCLTTIQSKIEEAGSYYQFWNIKYEGQRIITREPKNEIEIQPIIHCLLSDQFLMSSIEIIPEFNSGVGNLDFLFIGKIANKGFGYFCAEFKNAHSKKLKDGLVKQLPAYMENKKAKYGAYCVLDYYGAWLDKPEKFKDENLDFVLYLIKTKSKDPYLDNSRIFIYKLSKPISASKK